MVGLGDTKKKIQKMIDAAEDLYAKMNELRAQIEELRETVDTTSQQVDSIEHDVEEQRVLLEALADEQGLDVDEVLADAAIEEAAIDEDHSEAGDPAGGTAAEPED